MTCSQKHFRVVYKIEKIVKLVSFIWDNKQILLLVIFLGNILVLRNLFQFVGWKVGFGQKRRPSNQLTRQPCPGWTNNRSVPGHIHNISGSRLLTLWSLATFSFLSWKNIFPSQPFSASQNFISQWAFPRLQQAPESIVNAAKTIAVPRASQCRAVLYSVAGSKHQHFRQCGSEILGLLLHLIWNCAPFTLAFLFWFVQKRGWNRRTNWLAAACTER